MTDDTKNSDDVAEYLEMNYPELKGAVLTIHTNKSGEISETTKGRNKDELQKLREQSNEIDSWESPYKAIVSVLMLKEGWDVKNVTTIVGLRPYSSDSKILPEQTLGRGLRRMYFGRSDIKEYVSVIGTPAFMDFVESIKGEGVLLEKKLMGTGAKPISPMVIEVDKENEKKDIEKLDIEIPVMTARIEREYKNLADLDVSAFGNKKVEYQNSDGSLVHYIPDFFVKVDDKQVYIIETKGREVEDDKIKFERLEKWCEDANSRQSKVVYKA